MSAENIIKDVMRKMNSGLYDFTDNGRCSSCGQCCGNLLPLSVSDISRIKKYIKDRNIKPCNHFLPTVVPLPDMTCPFRDNDKKICTIYQVKPTICSDFRCDKAKKGFVPCKEMFENEFKIVNMRELFFGK